MTRTIFVRSRTAAFAGKSVKEALMPAEPIINTMVAHDLRQVSCTPAEVEISVQTNKFGRGCVVSGLGAHGASDKGVLVGDIVIAVNGYAVNDHNDCIAKIKSQKMSTLTILGQTRSVVVDKTLGGPGITLSNREGEAGVEVTALKADGVAAKAGLTEGDVVLSINGCLVIQHHHAISLIDASTSAINFVLAPPTHPYQNNGTSAYIDPANPNVIHITTPGHNRDTSTSESESAESV